MKIPLISSLAHAITWTFFSCQVLSFITAPKSSCRFSKCQTLGWTGYRSISISTGVHSYDWVSQKFDDVEVIEVKSDSIVSAISAAWNAIGSVIEDSEAPRIVLLPNVKQLQDVQVLQKLYNHMEQCQDCCESFGSGISFTPHPATSNTPVVFEVRSTGISNEFQFADDPDWDDDWDIDTSFLSEINESGTNLGSTEVAAIPDSNAEILAITKSWNEAVITGMGVCPFSVSADRAGLPVSKVHYPISKSSTAEGVYRDFWSEVEYLLGTSEREISTTLLITPHFGLENVEAFDILSQTLTEPLELLGLEDDIQLVFFHPQHTFRDGQARLGSAGAANYARRSPFPMINILRTPQVRLAQRSIPTGMVYQQNEEVLEGVGSENLQKMLENRDWSDLEGQKVNRKGAHVDYYRTARSLQQKMDMSLGQNESKNFTNLKEHLPNQSQVQTGNEKSSVQNEPYLQQSKSQKFEADTLSAKKLVTITSKMPEVAKIYSEKVENLEARVSNDDIKKVATVLMKRLMTKRPINSSEYEELDAGIAKLLNSKDIE